MALETRVATNRLARRQHGAVARRQLLELGVSGSTIGRWMRRGVLEPIHPGVYGVGHAERTERRAVVAAVLAVGDGAVASHVTAAALWRLGDLGLAPPHNVTAARRCQKEMEGVRVHHSTLDRRDRTTLGRIPVTMVPRSVIDTSGGLVDQEDVDDLVLEAIRIGRATPGAFEASLTRAGAIPGAGAVRRSLARFDPEHARRLMSRIETRGLVVFRDAGLPRPSVNRCLTDGTGAFVAKVDFSWLDGRVIVEIDGLRFHSSARQKRYDDARQNELVLSGRIVLRFSVADLDDPERVVAQIRRALELVRSR